MYKSSINLIALSAAIFVSSQLMAQNGIDTVEGKYVDVLQDGKTIARFMCEHDTSTKEKRHDTYKPYLHVMAADGKTPITKGPGGQFTHHRGIFLGWNKIGFQGKTFDLWHMKTSEIIFKGVEESKSDSKATMVKVRLHWMDTDGNVIIDEVRSMTFHHTDDKALFLADFVCELTAPNGDVSLKGDPEHAGFQFRPSDEVSKNKSSKYVFHAEGINPKADKDLPWVGLNYKLGEKSYSVQHMNHPSNPKGSIYSAYRDYGRFGSFPATNIKKGETLTLKYRIRITEGEMPEREMLAGEFAKYTK